MLSKFFLLTISVGLILLINGCGSKTPSLVVSRVTHFLVQGNGESLNFPLFAETISIETIERELAIAEHYHEKLAELYSFKSFSLVNSSVNEYLLENSDDLGIPHIVYEHSDSLTLVELSLAKFEESQAAFSFRISDLRSNQTRHHQVIVQNDQSASIGLLFDEENNRGHLVVISLNSIAITPNTTSKEFAEFLQRKNSLADSDNEGSYVSGDQRWMDELFGESSIQLPIPVTEEIKGDIEELIDYDTPPSPVYGMKSFQEAVKYPGIAMKEGREGRVLLKVYIDMNGEVTKTAIVKGTNSDLDSAAINAAKTIEFNPATKNGEPVGVWVTIPFDFKLN